MAVKEVKKFLILLVLFLIIFVSGIHHCIPHKLLTGWVNANAERNLDWMDSSPSSPLPSIGKSNSAHPSPSKPCASVILSLQQPNVELEQFEHPAKNSPVASVTLSGQHPNSFSSHAKNLKNQNNQSQKTISF